MNACDLGNAVLGDYCFPQKKNDPLSLEITVKYQAIALGSRLCHQCPKYAYRP